LNSQAWQCHDQAGDQDDDPPSMKFAPVQHRASFYNDGNC
jgi:hypothetical protein